jgi:transcriptional regulator GlxA family with amidase domain
VDELLVFSESMDAVDAVDGGAEAWWRMVKHYFTEMERARELYGCGYFSQAIESTLIRGLLVSQPSNYSAQIGQALGTRTREYVVRARSFIEANYREPIHLEDIETAAGVSRLKLFESFRKHTGFTPAAYLKDYRLRQARAQLQQDRSNQNVSSIALGVGFNHLGRFANDYKLVFSETPSETIRRTARSS